MKNLLEENYEEAIAAFTIAIQIDARQAPAYVGRGDAYTGKIQMAGVWSTPIDGSDTTEAWEETIAVIYQSAEKDYLDAIGLEEKLVEAYEKLADLYLGASETEKAIGILTKGYEVTGEDRLRERAEALEVLPDIPEQYHAKSITVTMYGAISGFCGHDFYAFDDQGRMLANIWYDEENEIVTMQEWVYDDALGKTTKTVTEPDYEEEMEAGEYDYEVDVENQEAPGTYEIDGIEDQGWYWEDMGDDDPNAYEPEDEESYRAFITDPTMAAINGRVEWENGCYGIYEYDSSGRVSTIYTYTGGGELLGHCVVTYVD